MLSQKYINSIKHGGFRSFVNKAAKLGIDITILLDDPRVLEFRYKDRIIVCVNDCIPIFKRTSNTATRNKAATKAVLSSFGIPTPRGILATSLHDLEEKLLETPLNFPLITKPVDQSLARGVTWNIQSRADLIQGIEHVKKTLLELSAKRPDVFLVEEMVPGEEYRVLVFNQAILSCVKKVPATVVGDGVSSIQQLIEVFNQTRMPGFEIKVDDTVTKNLGKADLTLQSVLPENTVQKLRNNLNMSDGGRAIECTDSVGQHIKRACLLALEALGMNYGGIDIITPSIVNPTSPFVVLEVNPLPYYNMHEKPLVEGKGIDFSAILLKELFPSIKIQP